MTPSHQASKIKIQSVPSHLNLEMLFTGCVLFGVDIESQINLIQHKQ